MEELAQIGRLLALGGLALAAIGGGLWLVAQIPGLERLPGTLRIERPGFTCVVPILASILLSILLTVLLNVILRLLSR